MPNNTFKIISTPNGSSVLADFLRSITPWHEVWKVVHNDKQTKHGWRLKHPEIGGFYRLDYHINMNNQSDKPDWLGDYIQIIGKKRDSIWSTNAQTGHKKRKRLTRYKFKNLTRSTPDDWFEAESLFAGSCTKVTEMEYLLYAPQEKK